MCIRPETYCTDWVDDMGCRFIDTGMGSEGLAGFRIMAYVFWPWSVKRHKQRYRALLFWGKYGLEATMEAFKVKRRTLYH